MFKNKFIIIVVIIMFFAFGTLAFFIFRPQKKPIALTLPSDTTLCKTISDEKKKSECMTFGYASWEELQRTSSQTTKNMSDCLVIPRLDAKDYCLIGLAGILQDKKVCGRISDKNIQQDCQNSFVVATGNWEACNAISDEEYKKYCFEQMIMRHETEGEAYCNSKLPEARPYCLELFFTRQAMVNNDYDACFKIASKESQKNCLKKMPKDSDGDKLPDYIESLRYSTDPANPDTDGDGFSDGDEVKSGHDPLKE